MKPKFIVLAPYTLKSLRTILDATLLNLAEFIIVGDKNKIIFESLKYGINYSMFDINHAVGDFNICLKAEKLIKEYNVSNIMSDGISKDILNRFFENQGDKIISNLLITNITNNDRLIFCCYPEEIDVDFDNYTRALIAAYNLMEELNISKINIGVVEDDLSFNSKTMTELIKLYFKQRLNLHNEFYTGISLSDIFNKSSRYTRSNLNLYLIKNYYHLNNYLTTFNHSNTVKISNISLLENFKLILIDKINSSDDILFSIFLLNKMQSKIYKNAI